MKEQLLGNKLYSVLDDQGVVSRHNASMSYSASVPPHGVVEVRVGPASFDAVFSIIQKCSNQLALEHNTSSQPPVFPLHSLEADQLATRFPELTHTNLASVLYASLCSLPSSGGLVPRGQNVASGSVFVFSRSDRTAFPEDFEDEASRHLQSILKSIDEVVPKNRQLKALVRLQNNRRELRVFFENRH